MKTDEQLMIEVQAGNHESFAILAGRYESELCGFFYRKTRDSQAAQDYCQDTLLKVFTSAASYTESGKFRGWLYQVARNLMLDGIRRHRRDALAHAGQSADAEVSPLATVAAAEENHADAAGQCEVSELIDTLIAELPEDQGRALHLHYRKGLALPEIAKLTDSPLPTVKSRVRLAREKLADKLRVHGIEV